MHPRNLRDLFLLAAIWGSSFLFMRLGVHGFGPVPLIQMRVGIGALFLLALSLVMDKMKPLRRHWKAISLSGMGSAALPFLCFAYAAQSMPAGTMAIINAMTPLFGALIARAWLQERLSALRILGLIIGFLGILGLVWPDLAFGAGGQRWPVLAAMAAPCFYAVAACYTSLHLKGVDPIACATGSMTASTVVLLPFAIWTWPATPISGTAWLSAIAIGILCTGIAYILFYRLIAEIGSTRAVTVTFLIPIFGVLWGVLFLKEALTAPVIFGTATVLAGTLLTTGYLEVLLRKTWAADK